MNLRRFLFLSAALVSLAACSMKPKAPTFQKEYSTPSSPCFRAVISNSLEQLTKAVDICRKSRTENGTTPLMLAASKGYAPLVDFLIQQGFDVNETDKSGDTALNYAVIFHQPEMAQLLILNRAEMATKREDGITTLMQAVQLGSPRMVQVLGLHPDGVNHRAQDGWTALYFAIRRKDESILRYLLSRGACIDTVDSYQQTPLDFAKEVGWAAGQDILQKASPCSLKTSPASSTLNQTGP